MTMWRQSIVTEARAWIGTPYVHQASCKGAGSDCLGLLRGIWRLLHDAEPEQVPAYTPDWAEPARDEVLLRAAVRWLVPKAPGVQDPGDILLFRMREGSIAKHLGIAAEVGARASFVHAYTGHGVIESPLSDPWARRIVARFEFPEGVQ
ncbi:peptidase [Pseudorhodobacter sp.]|uniref:peptidase n=1 Tax=Pseudorhodobacter sp. TaxID=1934400 RepID=UPI0026472851|nr:peptidase [Pseudorhodobacter sp.]MDN5786014.1 peptidase [Pseudorhodobacter sp.]